MKKRFDIKFNKFIFFAITLTLIASICISAYSADPVPRGTGRGIPQVSGYNGIVAASTSVAPSIGLKVLMEGGNAMDAAITTAAMITVAEPMASNIGGHGIMMMYDAKTGEVKCLDWGGGMPKAFTIDQWGTPPSPPEPGSVLQTIFPGTLAGWAEALDKYGTISLAEALQPAIDYAEQGISVYPFLRDSIANNEVYAPIVPEWARIFMPNGRVPELGERLKFPDLANTYKLIAKEGPDVFYKGELADKVVKYLNDNGQRFTKEEFANYKPIWRDLLSTTYRDGYEIFVVKNQNYQPVILTMFNIWENFNMKELGLYSPESIHLMIEASRVAIADRTAYYGDPDFNDVPYKVLTSKEYAKRITENINLNKFVPLEKLRPSTLVEELAKNFTVSNKENVNIGKNTRESTSNIAVIDKDHNVVLITQTIGDFMGSLNVVPGTGIILNNEGCFYDLEPLNGPNYPQGGKKVENQMGAAIVLKDGKYFAGIGSPGGTQIAQCLAKLLMLMIDYDLKIQEAIEAPRVRFRSGNETQLEGGIPWEIREKLWEKGHYISKATFFCGPSGVALDSETGVLMGGAEPFRSYHVVAY